MIWFFAFTTLGLMLTLFLISIKSALALGWRNWLGAAAGLSLFAWVCLKSQ